MKSKIRLFTFINLLSVLLLGWTVLSAQTNLVTNKNYNPANSQANFEVYFRAIVGHNNPTENPKDSKTASALIGKLDSDFLYKNYDLLFNNYQRVGNQGSIQSSNVIGRLGGLKVQDNPIPINWSLGAITNKENTTDKVKINSFVFTSDLPLQAGAKVAIQPLRYSIKQINVNLDKPTIIGSLPIPQTDETLFFVVTIKKLD